MFQQHYDPSSVGVHLNKSRFAPTLFDNSLEKKLAYWYKMSAVTTYDGRILSVTCESKSSLNSDYLI